MLPGPRRDKWIRWAVEAVLCLVIAYPFSGGPGKYLLGRGWITMRDWKSVYAPSQSAARAVGLDETYDAYTQWWGELGYSHHQTEAK